MKKYLLAFGVMATALTAFAANEYESEPPVGTLNAEAYPGGIGSIEINVSNAVINRECTQYATLSKGGVVLKAIPANNVRMVYTFDGFDKTEVGTPHITFYSQNDSPAALPGNYTVSIPYNFFTVDGKPNNRLEYSFTVVGNGIRPNYVPAAGSSVTELTKVAITVPNASRIQCTSASSIFLDYENPENDEETISVPATSVEISGTDTVIAYFDPIDYQGGLYLNISAGVIKYQIAGEAGTKTLGEQMIRYYIAPAMDNGFTLTPGPGTVTSIKPYKTENVTVQGSGWSYDEERSYYFDLKLPEGYTCGMAASRKTGLMMEQPDGTLKATSYYFNKWEAFENNSGYSLYLADQPEIKLAPGKYYLVIPKSSFYMKSPDAVAAAPYTEELKFGPWIVEGEPAKYEVSPAADEYVDGLSQIKITFPGAKEVSVNKIGWFTIMENEIEYDMRGTAEGNSVILNIVPALTTPGTYELISEASNITVDGVQTAVSATFTVVKSTISELILLSDGVSIEGKRVFNEDWEADIWVANVQTPEGKDTASLTFDLPYGYDQVYVMEYGVSTDALPAQKRIPADQILSAGFEVLPNNTLEDLTVGAHMLAFTYSKDGDCPVPSMLQVNVEKGTTGVDEVAVAAEEAEYYTLQGVKVANPDKGIYIKVVDGKAAKVNL